MKLKYRKVSFSLAILFCVLITACSGGNTQIEKKLKQ